jgi:hypothetical protein
VVEPVGPNPEGKGIRVLAIIGGAVIVLVGLAICVFILSLSKFGSAEDKHWTATDWTFASLASSFLALPIIVPGAFLIMRGIRGGPFVLRANARRAFRLTGRGTMLVGAVAFLAACTSSSPSQGVMMALSLNLVMIGAILALIAIAGRAEPTADEAQATAGRAHDRSVGEKYGSPDPYASTTAVSDSPDFLSESRDNRQHWVVAPVEPYPEGKGNRAAAIIGGAVIVFAGLFVWLALVGLSGLDSAEDLHLTWYDYIIVFLAYSFLFLPIIVPGAFLIMRGIRGGPFRLKANARRAFRLTGRGTMLVGAALFLAGLAVGEENPAQGGLIYLSLNLVMIGAILALIAIAGRPERPDDEAEGRAPEGWLPDPSGRYPDRWWDGGHWTQWVRDKPGGTRSGDPPGTLPPPARPSSSTVASRQAIHQPGA